MPDREKVINGLRDIDMFIAGRLGHEKAKNFLRTIDETIVLLKDDETWIQYINDHIAMCKEEVERLYKEQENASKRNPVIVCPHCGKRVK